MTVTKLSEKRKYPLAKTGVKTFTVIPEATDKVCNLTYLLSVSRGNKKIIDNITTVFFKETKAEMLLLTVAIAKNNYTHISNISHKLKSAFSILGITLLDPVFKEMEQLSSSTSSIGNIELLNRRVNLVFNQAREEMLAED
jgi:HPt (histidine-containing phosphotransfer) domain-containing protein